MCLTYQHAGEPINPILHGCGIVNHHLQRQLQLQQEFPDKGKHVTIGVRACLDRLLTDYVYGTRCVVSY